MTKTLVDIDDDLLSAVSQQLGTKTKKDTVNAALAEVLRVRRLADHVGHLREGAVDDLLDVEVMKGAWR